MKKATILKYCRPMITEKKLEAAPHPTTTLPIQTSTYSIYNVTVFINGNAEILLRFGPEHKHNTT